MREIIRACGDDRLRHIDPVLVIASREDAGGIQKAKAEGVADENVVVLKPKSFNSPFAFGEALIAACRTRRVNFVGQYGWLPLTPPNFIEAYAGMIVNQHPGPLDPGRPDFGGQGMYGCRVHCARLWFARAAGHEHPNTEVVSHRVTAEYDRGAVLHRGWVQILSGDNPGSLQERALPEEHRVQIETLRMFSEGSVHEVTRESPLVPDEQIPLLIEAKRIAARLYPKG